jgi:release factor glutamine methyltransferase
VVARLRLAGCLAADDEAHELVTACAGDPSRLETLLGRRCQGEPLAWLTGSVEFCGERVLVRHGVYVPRWQSEALAIAAVEYLPADGFAIDLCTGAGAIARVLSRRRPGARVIATDIDPLAVACARANGVSVVRCDLASGLAPALAGTLDVVVAVVPYVPDDALHLLPRDVTTYEPRHALDGGPGGLTHLVRAARSANHLLRAGGHLLLELGDDQDAALNPVLERFGYRDVEVQRDDEGDLRAIVCRQTRSAA